MQEIIIKSKLNKIEKQKEKEARDELTERLDKEWKEMRAANILGLNTSKRKDKEESEKEKEEKDDYNVLYRKLQFEARARADDRLKTEEELAVDERQKLIRLEAERLNRMSRDIDDDQEQEEEEQEDEEEEEEEEENKEEENEEEEEKKKFS